LVTRAVATDDPAELEGVIRELREALHEHAKSLRRLAAEKLTSRQNAE
jgi:ABC-type transporter Mla subunit MlaD